MSHELMAPVRTVGPALAREARRPMPCVIVILGAGGDLTHRKLMPAFFHLGVDGALPADFAIVGVARLPKTDDAFRSEIRESLVMAGLAPDEHREAWQQLASRLTYVQGSLDDPATYAALQARLASLKASHPAIEGHLFYLAIPPSLYASVITRLSESGVLPRTGEPTERPWARVIIEKPFGRDLLSARELNGVARRAMAEHQIYRIDHYLGKETVQNLLVLRFANSIFEPIWNRHHVDHVQITTAESVGVEHRGPYYEEAGVLRDMFQNHLLQVLALIAMEPPTTFRADAVRDEKVKVLRAIRSHSAAELSKFAVRGQYGPGVIGGQPVVGYRQEPRVAADSVTPTYAAMRVLIDNWRWKEVPFFLRSGKRLPARTSEIAIQFKRPPHLMFALSEGERIDPNVLVLRIQPSEGISFRFEVKVPGLGVRMAPVNMDFDYAGGFGTTNHEAYETLLLDCMLGDATLFIRSDEAEAAWEIVDPLIAHWAANPPTDFPNYAAGSAGPALTDELIAGAGTVWRHHWG